MMRVNKSIKLLLILMLCMAMLCIPTSGRADVVINNLGVTPIQPRYEIVGDEARLNCEMTFENPGAVLDLIEWKVRAHYSDKPPIDFPGVEELFWYNVRIYSTFNGLNDITKFWAGYFENGAYNQGAWLIPGGTRVVFLLPYTNYPVADRPSTLTVFVKFNIIAGGQGMKEIQFEIDPIIHASREHYIFPVGFDKSEEMGRGWSWALTDGSVPTGDIHGAGHELYTNHRRFLAWWDGENQPVLCNQRYAHDLCVIDAQGNDHVPMPDGIEDRPPGIFYAWDRKVFAMARGIVKSVKNDIPDNMQAGEIDYPPGGGAGNHVMIEHGNGEVSIYAHIRQGSIPDDIVNIPNYRVEQGEEIGRVGNSGNSSGPHLHFVLVNKADLSKTDSLPIRFTNIWIMRDGWLNFQPWPFSLPSGCRIFVD